MPVADFLKEKLESLSVLATAVKRQGVLDSNSTLPEDAKYKIGEMIRLSGRGIPLNDLAVLDIKAGGFAIVYIVADQRTRTFYAVKTFQDWCLKKPEVVADFIAEAETWLQLGRHPNLVYAHTVFNLNGRPHILLEYVVGTRLWDKVKVGPLPIPIVLKYAVQFCSGMSHAREKIPGFVHGDIKPNNCLVTAKGILKITDFGHVRLWPKTPGSANGNGFPGNGLSAAVTQWGAGTPLYMAPEQFDASSRADVRSDVYSFGVMLFEMLTGQTPFQGESHAECFRQHQKAIPPDPHSLNTMIPRQLGTLVSSCLAKRPEDRPENFGILAIALREISGDQEKHAPGATQILSHQDLLSSGNALASLGHYEEALSIYAQVLSRKPRLAEVWNLNGQALLNSGRYDEALRSLNRALELDPKLAAAWSHKGSCLDHLGQPRAALEYFDRALKLDPQLTFAWNSKGRSLCSLRRTAEALQCFKRAQTLDAQNLETHNNLGKAFLELGQVKEAIEAYSRAIDLNPLDAQACKGLGDSYLAAERFQEAVNAFKKALLIKPDCQDLQQQCRVAKARLRSQEKGAREILESDIRLSESLLWPLVEQFYDSKGVSAWDQIPFYPTSNPFIADAYAELIIAFLRDYEPYLNTDEPLHILEMATGTGCFSFYLLRALMAKIEYFQHLKRLPLRYVMTDFTESNLKFWESRNQLQPYLDANVLDFAVWRPENQDSLVLKRSRTCLQAGSIRNPLIAIANYFFDSIRHDLFRISKGRLFEGRVTFYRDSREVNPNNSVTCDQLKMLKRYCPVGEDYYADSRFNSLLSYYSSIFKNAWIQFPLGALDCVRNLQVLSRNSLVLLSSDMGSAGLEFMEADRSHSYSSQHSVPAFPVNYHVINRYFEDQGGTSLFTSDKTNHLVTTMNVLLEQPEVKLENSRYMFEEKIKKQNLINHLYDCQHLLCRASSNDRKTMRRSCLAFLKLSGCDPTVFTLCGNRIYRSLDEIEDDEKEALVAVLAKVRNNIYSDDRKYNCYFWLGKIYYGLRLYSEALESLSRSVELFGPDEDSIRYIERCKERNSNCVKHL